MEDHGDFSNMHGHFGSSLGFGVAHEQQQQWMDQQAAAALSYKIQQLQSLLLQIAWQQQEDSPAMELLLDQLLLATRKCIASAASSASSSSNSVTSDPLLDLDFDSGEDLGFLMGAYFATPKEDHHDHLVEHKQDEELQPKNGANQAQDTMVIELDAMEILAVYTCFCEVCGKGFKRDANLRMHMRGHGEEYKTPLALARPQGASASPLPRWCRYSCPYKGCNRNKRHAQFRPLKTLLCVKNHYRRSHCPKLLTCSKCSAKQFSVTADLRTHEKHCGREKWECSCGTTFSRKDKLVSHLSLFVGLHSIQQQQQQQTFVAHCNWGR